MGGIFTQLAAVTPLTYLVQIRFLTAGLLENDGCMQEAVVDQATQGRGATGNVRERAEHVLDGGGDEVSFC